jgi:hypothetical protein
VEAGLGFGIFQKILKRIRKVSAFEQHRVPVRLKFRNVSGCFRKFQLGNPVAPRDGSENPVVEHKKIARHDARVSRVSHFALRTLRCRAKMQVRPAFAGRRSTGRYDDHFADKRAI